MEVTAKVKNLKIAPKKVRLVAGLVRGKGVVDAMTQLKFTNKKSSMPVYDLIKSAAANAEHNFKLDKNNLFIKEISVNKGSTLKRYMPRAFGRASMLRKTMSHISIVLGEINPTSEKEGVKPKKSSVTKTDSREKITEQEDVKEDKPNAKKADAKDLKEAKGQEIHDPRAEGKHRHKQHLDKSMMKAKGGAVKKASNTRKAG